MILCDTGPLVAAFNAADRDHGRCTEFLRENWSRLVVPSLAVTEVCHLLADPHRRGRPGLDHMAWTHHACGEVCT